MQEEMLSAHFSGFPANRTKGRRRAITDEFVTGSKHYNRLEEEVAELGFELLDECAAGTRASTRREVDGRAPSDVGRTASSLYALLAARSWRSKATRCSYDT